MEIRTLEITAINEQVLSLRISTDANPYIGPWYVPALREAIEKLNADPAVRAVVVEGGSRYFSAGASRDMLMGPDGGAEIPTWVPEIPRLLLSISVPTVAAMAGHAIGGGFVLGLWCDAAVLAEESLYGANFMALGFTPGMGSTVVLEEALGAPLARELLLTGRISKGRELKAAGGLIAHAVAPRAEVRARAVAIAEEMAKVPREALVLLKRTLSQRRQQMLDRANVDEKVMAQAIFEYEGTRTQIGEAYAVMPPARVQPALSGGQS